MSEQNLTCAGCDKHMATLRDAKVRNGMVVYCSECNRKLHILSARAVDNTIPDFLSGLMGKRS